MPRALGSRLGALSAAFVWASFSACLCPQHSQPRGRRVRSSLSEAFGAIQLFFGEGRGWWPRSGGVTHPGPVREGGWGMWPTGMLVVLRHFDERRWKSGFYKQCPNF